MTDTRKIKPCPFCGGEGELKTFRQEDYGCHCRTVGVACKDCESYMRKGVFECEKYDRELREHFDITEEAEARAVHAWNQRAEDESSPSVP